MVLQKVKVSNYDADKFDQLIQNHVKSWKEESVVRSRTGIALETYDEFLKGFQKSTGISDEDLESLKDIKYCKQADGIIKSFTVNAGAFTGAYGLVALSRNDDEIDLAYALYRFQVAFRPPQRTTTALVFVFDNVGIILSKEEEEEPWFRKFNFSGSDMTKLRENFIKQRALSSFQSDGIVKKINYVSQIEDTV